jgi:hypothetical protein
VKANLVGHCNIKCGIQEKYKQQQSNIRMEKQMEQVEGFSIDFGTLEGFINM